MKSEPEVYSVWDLERDRQTLWDGVRNYQARNYLRQMQVGDLAFFYHSNAKPPGIVGLMTVTETEVVDPTQFDPQSDYYDPKAKPEAPRWQTVRLEFQAVFEQGVTLTELKEQFNADELWVVRKGNRLSVIPVDESIAQRLLQMAQYEVQ